MVLTSNTQATKKSRVFKLRMYGKGIQCHSPQLFELKEKSNKIKSRYLNFFLVIVLVIVVTHNTFTQLNIPMQDLWTMNFQVKYC